MKKLKKWQIVLFGALIGIVNGIDYDEYNSKTDSLIVKNYSVEDFRKLKVKNKVALQEELGLPKDPKKMMIGISHMDMNSQKFI